MNPVHRADGSFMVDIKVARVGPKGDDFHPTIFFEN